MQDGGMWFRVSYSRYDVEGVVIRRVVGMGMLGGKI